jgi:uncharacterized phiE125 gp8 family phage protein
MTYTTPAPGQLLTVNKLTQSPNVLAVSMEEMKLALRADGDDEDVTIRRNIEAATDWFEIRCAWRLTPATYEALVTGWCAGPITIPRGPLRGITAVQRWNCDDEEWENLTGDQWRTQDMGCEFLFWFPSSSNFEYPSTAPGAGIRILFDAGFDGAESDDTTAAGEAESGMIQCLKTLASLMFQKREEATDAEKDMIVRRYRKFW